MAIKFHYNKTSLQELQKQLKVRINALPTLKNKESALRVEVKRAKTDAAFHDEALNNKLREYDDYLRLWTEFKPGLVGIKDVHLKVKKIAGVKTPVLEGIDFSVSEFSIFKSPGWFLDGIELIKELAKIGIDREIFIRKMELLENARKKTTQKVNLYEKVQIPGYDAAILKIKRFMEDEENLSKSSMKIVKTRIEELQNSAQS